MKYLSRVVICLVGLLFITSVSSAKPIIIKGKLVKSGTSTIYLYKYLGAYVFAYDSTKSIDGVFEFKYSAPISTGFYKLGYDKTTAITFVAGSESVVVTGNLDVQRSIVFAGSKENDLYTLYQKTNKNQSEQNELLNKQAQQLQSQPGMTEELFNEKIAGLRIKSDSLNKTYNSTMQNMAANHPGLFMTKVITMFLFDGKTAETFFTPAEFSDKEYAAGDMLVSKTQAYFQYFVPQDINSWKNATDKILSACAVGSDNKHVYYASIIPLFIQNDVDYATILANAFVKEFPLSEEAKQLKKSIPKGAVTIGEVVPDLVLEDINGNVLALSSLRGKVVLIDFWASWCGPCRGENPNVVAAYNSYKDKGFTVFSVSLDTNKDQWLAAINKDGLIWTSHVSDLKGWKSDAAKLYNVKGIPATFLINAQGQLVAVNLRGEELKAKLAELLK